MRIALGQDVFASDGAKVGTVDRVVLDDVNHHVEQIVVHKGVIFSSDKLIDRAMVDRVDGEGVHLTIGAAEERKLPDFYAGLYYEWGRDPSVFSPMPIPGGYAGALLYTSPPVPGRGYPGRNGFFDLAPIDPPQLRPEGNLSLYDVWVSKGADVVSADDHKLGHVHDVLYDAAGGLTGVVVRAGLVHKHDLEIPAARIAEIDDDRILLNVPAAEVEKAAAPAAG